MEIIETPIFTKRITDVFSDNEVGLIIEVNETPFNFYDWSALVAQKQDEKSTALDIRQLKLHSQQAMWKETPLGIFDLTLKPEHGYCGGDDDKSFSEKRKIKVRFKD